jgi:hypothetical protein
MVSAACSVEHGGRVEIAGVEHRCDQRAVIRQLDSVRGMIVTFIPGVRVARRTINLPEPTEALVRELAHDGESFSAAVTRLIEAGARSAQGAKRPAYVAAGEGPEDLAAMAEHYLRAPVSTG